ncbi:MAG: hypothetical protein KAV82_08025 [Phycisphaerae bacterium]|nr:hypothetical protein [Phycisphaerae bacterium]
MHVTKLVGVVLFVMLVSAVHAPQADAAPSPPTYQGQLKLEGSPVTGQADFEFTIYDAEVGGNMISMVKPVFNVEVVDGLFTVELQTDFSPSTVFAGYPRWLEIEVAWPSGSAFAMLDPRQEITPAPVAYYAFDAPGGGGESPWEIVGSDIHYTDGFVGIGTDNPGHSLHVVADAASGVRAIFGEATASTGTTYGIYGLTESTAGRGVYGHADSPTGTTYGIYGLTESTAGRGVYGYADSSTGTTYGVYGRSASTGGRAVYGYATAASGTTYGVYGRSSSPSGRGVYGSNSNGGYAIYGYASGEGSWAGYFSGRGYFSQDVGIGTTSPDAPLHVAGGNNWDVANSEGDFKIGNSLYRLKMGVALSGGGAGSARIFAQGGSHKLTLGSNQTDVLTVIETDGGAVGIGTANPEERLHVAGKLKVEGTGYVIDAEGGVYGVRGNGSNSGVRGVGGSYGTYGSGDIAGAYGYSSGGKGVYGYSGSGIGVKAKSGGTSTSHPALHVENTAASGINIVSTGTSSDANLVIANKGTGDIIKGFSGASGGDLVFRVANDGRTSVSVLHITGGSDLAERFEVGGATRPGMVVAIDPDHPGKLCIASGAYNRRVAGVISGANELAVGMVLADLPGAKNSQPVALSGRVWVYCDATEKAIEPGDMLTTAERPGYAMAVTDYDRAHGAVIGKAMTQLEKGESGLVLVLVNLQ